MGIVRARKLNLQILAAEAASKECSLWHSLPVRIGLTSWLSNQCPSHAHGWQAHTG